MKRSDFLAFIPALSAIPLIGKEIVKKSDRIEIYQPEEVKNFVAPKKDVAYVAVIKNDVIVATGYLTEVNINAPIIDTTCRDSGGAQSFMKGPSDITIQASVTGPITQEMMDAFQDSFRGNYRTW